MNVLRRFWKPVKELELMTSVGSLFPTVGPAVLNVAMHDCHKQSVNAVRVHRNKQSHAAMMNCKTAGNALISNKETAKIIQ